MKSVLCIDDDPKILQVRAASLGQAGFLVATCDRAFKALSRLSAGRIDAVVTDFEMPEMNGLLFANLARVNGYRQPIILCSGAIDMPVDASGSVDRMIWKSEAVPGLVKALQNCLSLRRSEPTATYHPG